VSAQDPQVTIDGTKMHITSMTIDEKAVNVLLSQDLAVTALGTDYTATANISMNGSWVPLNIAADDTQITRLPEGNYLVTSVMSVGGAVDSGMIVPVSRGVDVSSAPISITTRLVLNPSKTKVLSQAVQVLTKK